MANNDNRPVLYRGGLGTVRPLNREIAHRLIMGQTLAEISSLLHIKVERLRMIVQSPMFKMELARIDRAREEEAMDVSQALGALAPVALDTLERTMYNTKSEGLKVKCAESILDRAGFGSVTKTVVSGKVEHSYANMTDDEMRRLLEDRLKRMKEEEVKRLEMVKNAEALEVEIEDSHDEIEQIRKEFSPED